MTFIIYWNLPISITRKSDIQFGNKLIENIDNYQKSHKQLSNNDDWKVLKSLGFKMEYLGTKPSYQTDNNGTYELIYLEGFDGPYLMWNSEERKWKIDNPSIYAN
ncbi:hypothetical protein [Chryseobacterium sp. T1]